ncbi:hypothetical protein LAUMK41_00205 [Mycobacterium attenuatum]|uniref:Uncharacterized protein n=1 Tax=Mycobacterium attenuatum TaxID=2341086 RepID=A0A498PMM5_9MYCO|nr:hypothetical protein [Mycobacterium attenuatum]VBA31968.1 hypothetical protein LAUMK136_00166 [Mycobacterium attenuatum]VBA45769.1 hypothetical protein LAUMK41_00205 [Mycobacterium attenuatum]
MGSLAGVVVVTALNKGRFTLIAAGVDVSAGIRQEPHYFVAFSFGCKMQRCDTLLVDDVDVRAGV